MATPVKYRNGLIGTIIFHSVLLFLLFYLAFYTPLPLPAEQGILVDFGNSDMGQGNYEPRMNDAVPVQPQPTETSQSSEQEDPMLTQDAEETVAVPPKPETKPKKPVEKPKEQKETPKEEPKPVVEEKPQPTIDPRSVYQRPGRGDVASTATSQGIAGGQGNQGVVTGTADAGNYGPGGGTGDGNRFSLDGRNIVGRLPEPEGITSLKETVIVVVKIQVDRNGRVIAANNDLKRSQNSISYPKLIEAAEEAAKKARFSVKSDAPVTQEGYITYTFKLQGN